MTRMYLDATQAHAYGSSMTERRVSFPPRYALIIIAAVTISAYLLFLCGTVLTMAEMWSPTHPRVMTATTELPQSDFARFWFVGKSLDAHLAAPSLWFKQTFRIDILNASAKTLVWLYPPTMNLLAMLFAHLPLAASFWIWRLACLVACGGLLYYAGLPWVVILAGLFSPAALHDMLGGQSGTLVGASLVAALLLMDRRPKAAGAIAGVLCIKPQMAVVIPLIVLQKRWLAMFICTAVVVAITGVSAAVEGVREWIWFFTISIPATRQILEVPFKIFFPAAGYTVFMMARSLHASLPQAWLAQGLCSLVACALVCKLWNRPRQNSVPAMAATISLAALITPYGFLYDLTGFAIAMAAMVFAAPANLKPAFAFLWLASGYTLTMANLSGLLLFPLAAAAAAALSWSLLPPPQPAPYHTEQMKRSDRTNYYKSKNSHPPSAFTIKNKT